MADSVSQFALPVTLAIVMLVMGLHLSREDFTRVLNHPKATVLGLLLQLLLLPILALLVAYVFQLSAIASAGLFLLSLCPGGATSNAFSMFANGDVALSISLTAITSVIVPFTIPLSFMTYLMFSGTPIEKINLPVVLMMKQLIVVTLLPVMIGMTLRHLLLNQVLRILPALKKLSGILMLTVIGLLFATNHQALIESVSSIGIAVVSLCVISMLSAIWLSKGANLSFTSTKTIAIEVGIQNAGTAMLIAFTVLQQPALAMTPLLYGLLMNIPALAFVVWANTKDTDERVADM